MRFSVSLLLFSMIAVAIAYPVSSASAMEQGHYSAFAARQALCDKVTVAMADGRVTRVERYNILTSAKQVLKPEEYETFKQAFNRVAPPPASTTVAKRSVKPTAMPSAKLAQATPEPEEDMPVAPSPPEAVPETSPVPSEHAVSSEKTTISTAERVAPTSHSR